MFLNCSKLKTLDLSTFSAEKLTNAIAMFGNCDSLEELNLGRLVIPQQSTPMYPAAGMFAKLVLEEQDWSLSLVTGSISSIKQITMSGTCILTPGEGDTLLTATGTIFDYKEPLSWSAYYQGNTSNADEGTPDAILTGFEEFKAYQESHPGITTFVLNTSPVPPGPTPGPTPDPEPQPQPSSEDSTAANNNALAKTGDMLAIVSALTGAAILSGLGLLGFSRKNAYRK